MFPKEHGAWNALLISLAAGWAALGSWNGMALAATLFWFSSFVLRAPLATAGQYRIADPSKARRALFFSIFLIGVFLVSGWYFWSQTPPGPFRPLLRAVIPAGFLFGGLSLSRPSLRFLSAEVLGFSAVCLSAPVLYLTGPVTLFSRAAVLYVLVGGYFILSLFYVRVRFDWLKRSRSGEKRSPSKRLGDMGPLLAVAIVWAAGLSIFPNFEPWRSLAPLYALGRVAAGTLAGRTSLPMMRLGLLESGHSVVFLALLLGAWK